MRERERRMRGLFAQWKQSGDSLKAFGKKRKIPYTTLQYWKRRLEGAGKSASPQFIPVRVVEGQKPEPGGNFSIRLRNGLWIEAPGDFDRGGLKALLDDLSTC